MTPERDTVGAIDALIFLFGPVHGLEGLAIAFLPWTRPGAGPSLGHPWPVRRSLRHRIYRPCRRPSLNNSGRSGTNPADPTRSASVGDRGIDPFGNGRGLAGRFVGRSRPGPPGRRPESPGDQQRGRDRHQGDRQRNPERLPFGTLPVRLPGLLVPIVGHVAFPRRIRNIKTIGYERSIIQFHPRALLAVARSSRYDRGPAARKPILPTFRDQAR